MKIKLLVPAIVLSIVTIFNGVALAQIPKNPTTPTTNTQEIGFYRSPYEKKVF